MKEQLKKKKTESRLGHTARCITKQNKQKTASRQTKKTQKPPRTREVVQWYIACLGPGYHPSIIK